MKINLPILILLLYSSICLSQSSISEKLNKFTHLTHPEKLFVFTDRDSYHAGDTIWFSAWLLNSDDLSKEKLEKILYIDIADPDDEIVSHHLFQLDSGEAIGQINLSNTLRTGIYKLIAYTNYMKNKGADYLFEKPITIYLSFNTATNNQTENTQLSFQIEKQINESASVKDSSISEQSPIDVSFLPEGGNWVDNIPSKIAFIASAPDNYPLDYSGIVYDQNNNFITLFQPYFNGKGILKICPKPNKRYHAVIEDINGRTSTFNLPPAQTHGFTILVNDNPNDPSQLGLIINDSRHSQNDSSLSLVLTQNQKVIQSISFVSKSKMNMLTIPKSLFKTGIAIITLFDSNNLPLCERLYFINQNDFLIFSVDSISSNNDSMLYKIKIRDKNNNPADGAFSVSITGKHGLNNNQFNSTSSIVNYLYLKSDLPGIEDDCSYFFKTNAESKWLTDLTMLTNGWRQFTWQEVMIDSIPKPNFPMERNFYIAGQVCKTRNDKPAKNIEVSLLGLGKNMVTGKIHTNDQGNFIFAIDPYTDTLSFTIKTRSQLNIKWNYNISLLSNLGDGKNKKLEIINNRYERSLYINSTDKSTIHNNTFELIKEQTIPSNPIHSEDFTTNTTSKIDSIPFFLKEKKIHDDNIFAFDTTDINLDEAKITAKKILTPMEKMREQYGIGSQFIGEEQLNIINDNNSWNSGFMSIIDKIFPNYVSLTKHARIYFFVDGVLYAFTHRPKIPFCVPPDIGPPSIAISYGELLQSLDMHDIKNIERIENPKLSPFADALALDPNLFCEENGAEVIISIQTNYGSNKYFVGIVKTELYGYTPARRFYTPKYSNKEDHSNFLTTYLWAPFETTNNNGEIPFKLPRDIQLNDYTLQVNGLSNSMIPGYLNWSFKNDTLLDLTIKPNTNISNKTPSNNNTILKNHSDQNISTESDSSSLIQIAFNTENKTPITIAEISSAKNAFTNQTIFNGIWVINKNELFDNDTIAITVPGWGNLSTTRNDIIMNNYNLVIPYQVINSNEAIDAKKLAQKTIISIPSNIKLYSYDIIGVFRQLLFKNDKLSRLTDFEFTQRLNGFNSRLLRQYKRSINEIHQFETIDPKQKIPFKLNYDETTIAPPLDPLSIYLPFKNNASGYQWSYVGQQLFNNRLSTFISFQAIEEEPNNLHSGIFIIDNETKGIAHYQWYIMSEKKKLVVPNNYIAPQKNEGIFKLSNDTHYATFTFDDKDWKLKSASNYLQFIYNEEYFTVQNEMIITERPKNKTKEFKTSSPIQLKKKIKIIKNVSYHPQNWRSGNVLLPDLKLQEQVKRLHELTIYKKEK